MIFPLAHFHVLGSRRCLVRFAACLPLCLSALPECLCLPWSAPLLPCAALPLALSHAPSRPLKRHLLDWRFCISTLFVFCLLASFFTPFFSFFFSIRPLHHCSSSSICLIAMATLSLQHTLPKLPVPSLDETLAKYLRSIEPLTTPEELERSKVLAKDFVKPGGLGQILQQRLLDVDRAAPNNWLDDTWWIR